MGQALFDVVACMVSWEERHGRGPGSPGVQIKHRGCAAARSTPKLICTECEISVNARDVENPRASQPSHAQLPEKKANYRRTAVSRGASEARLPLPESLEIVGDKWTIEILVIVFMRVGKFVDIQRLSGISSNVLSDRLGCLMRLGLLRQAAPDEDGLTGSYRITEKGLAFYPVLLALQAWADAWLPDRVRSPLRLRHTPCGRQLKLAVVCDACGQKIDASTCEVLLQQRDQRATP
jgi:DNA-binding HxlR family transcriptional regulator